MNDSDILVALTLAVTAFIFLVQTDDEILKLKIRLWEKWLVGIITCIIILLVNAQIFERAKLTFYFNLHGWYLTTNEWALTLFLFLMCNILNRVFNKTIYNTNPSTIFCLIQKYRAEKKFFKLQNMLLQVFQFKNFDHLYAEKLNEIIFNDTHLIEYFSSNSPKLLIRFAEIYPESNINMCHHLFHILNGLFAEKNNPIFSEIRQFKIEEGKVSFLDGYDYIRYSEFKYNETLSYKTPLPIISWLVILLGSFAGHLKEDTSYFLNQFKKHATENNNQSIYSEDEINKALSRDTIFSSIQLFRILLVEISFTNKRVQQLIDRVLLLFYSSWDFIQKTTYIQGELQEDNRYGQKQVALDNDAYTVNEYLLKYLFEGYCTLFILNKTIVNIRNDSEEKEKEDTAWIFHQLFRKVDCLIASDAVSVKSKKYFIERQIALYFDISEYFNNETLKNINTLLISEFNYSLEDSGWGNSEIYRNLFREVCNTFDFYKKNNVENIHRAEFFYKELQPYTHDLESRICDK